MILYHQSDTILKNIVFLKLQSAKQTTKLHFGLHFENSKVPKSSKNVTLDVTLDELSVLNLLREDGKMTQKQLAESINKSERTIKTITASLKEKGVITRINGKRFGYWKVNN